MVLFVQLEKREKHRWGILLLVKLQNKHFAMGIFTFFKLCKWYQIVQSITYHKVKRSHKKIVLAYSNKSRSNDIVFVRKAHLHTSLTDKVFYPILPQTLKHKILVQFEMHQKNVMKGSSETFCLPHSTAMYHKIKTRTPNACFMEY